MSSMLLGVDAGTSVIKSILFDLDGREIAGAAQETQLLHPRPAWVEQDMDAVWDAVTVTVRAALEQAGCTPDAIAAVGITGQGDGTWLVDEAGRPVRPAITWLDGRVGELVRQSQESGLSNAVFAITGTALNTSNQALHLRWLRDHEPATLDRTHAVLRAKDWIFLNFTGQVSTDESDASHTYFAAATRRFDPRVLALLDIADLQPLLPPIRPSRANRAPVLPAIAAQLGLAPGTPVIAGPFDVAAADLGAGVLEPGDACTILGTAGIHQIVLDRPVNTPANIGYTMCHVADDRLVRLLPTMTGTLNLQWFAREFFAAERAATVDAAAFWAQLEARAAAVPLGYDGVLYHPYIDPAGERSPFVRPEARAQFTGMSVNHTRDTLLRAVYEGVVLSALDCYEHLAMPVRALKLTGGGARSPFWAQMFADALGCPVDVVDGSEHGARGTAMNAGVAVGLYPSYAAAVTRCVRPARTYAPVAANTAAYRTLLQFYRATYRAMFPVWAARAGASQEQSS